MREALHYLGSILGPWVVETPKISGKLSKGYHVEDAVVAARISEVWPRIPNRAVVADISSIPQKDIGNELLVL